MIDYGAACSPVSVAALQDVSQAVHHQEVAGVPVQPAAPHHAPQPRLVLQLQQLGGVPAPSIYMCHYTYNKYPKKIMCIMMAEDNYNVVHLLTMNSLARVCARLSMAGALYSHRV